MRVASAGDATPEKETEAVTPSQEVGFFVDMLLLTFFFGSLSTIGYIIGAVPLWVAAAEVSAILLAADCVMGSAMLVSWARKQEAMTSPRLPGVLVWGGFAASGTSFVVTIFASFKVLPLWMIVWSIPGIWFGLILSLVVSEK